jgi:serine/threonine-protein kinase
MSVQVGDIVGGVYRIERPLGAGGMGAVYVAFDKTLERRVAIKMLHASLPGTVKANERFRLEALAATRVRHPNIIEIFAANLEDSPPWIVMELLEGETLAARQARSPLTVDETLWIADSMLSALGAIEHEKLVHRDLKPENIFLEDLRGEKRVKLLDFGIAKWTGTEIGKLTNTGLVIGTPFYFSPEQALGDPLDIRSDLFSLGVVLFECLSGKRPYEAKTYEELLRLLMTRDAPKLATVAPDTPEALAAIIDRALARSAADRYQHAREMREAIRGYAREHAVSLPGERTPVITNKPASEPSESSVRRSASAPEDVEPLAQAVNAPDTEIHDTRPTEPDEPPPPKKSSTKKKKKKRTGPGGRTEVTIAKTVALPQPGREVRDSAPSEPKPEPPPEEQPLFTPWTLALGAVLLVLVAVFLYLVVS